MRTPGSTYRLQITEDFDLFEAARRLPYLHDLGVDWVYLSPLLGRGARQRPRVRRGRPRPDRPVPRRRRGSGGAVAPRRAGSGLGVLVDIVPNHVGVAAPRRERLVVGRAHARPGLGVRRRVRHRLGRPAAAGSGSRSSATTTVARGRADREPRVAGGRAALPRPPRSRSLPAPPTTARTPPTTCTPGSTTSWSTGGWPTHDLNYRRFFAVNTLAAIRVEDRERVRRSRTTRSGAGSTRGSSTGCASTTPTACATPSGYLDDLAALTGGAYVLVEKILEPGEELPAVVGDRRHHRLRRAGARSTGCSPTRPAQAPLDALETRLRGARGRLAPS